VTDSPQLLEESKMHHSSRSGRWSARALAAILLVACLGLVACGSDDDEGGGGGSAG
jgi:hypothetical protein